MNTTRLEAFSDAVIAILITIMVLEFKSPEGATLGALRPLLPTFLTYVLSFVFLGIYWNNHHHLMHITQHVNGKILWANLHLLFWLSMVPLATGWMSENHAAPLPVAVYGGVLLCAALAWMILQGEIVRHEGSSSPLREALGADLKARGSLAAYTAAIPLAFVWPPASIGLYVAVALTWLIPDRRIESRVYRDSGRA
ncbi:MAG TPA: TMEM175 family protein [Candidatus Krumholzibacteria bacterium]|nr:TMEM175 family protein [Candidatus Krumholzibacteria bacterium]